MRDLFAQCTYVLVCHARAQECQFAKRARQKQEKVQKKKARCGESSEARYKLCSLFMFDSTVVVLELHGLSPCAMRCLFKEG